MEDLIRLKSIRVATQIGVPDLERATPQTLEVDLILIPREGFAGAADEIGTTVDYFEVWKQVHTVAGERPRKLIETFAEDLAKRVLENPRIVRVGVEVRKFILPDTGSVGVSIWREQGNC